jgi:hypothetical protein
MYYGTMKLKNSIMRTIFYFIEESSYRKWYYARGRNLHENADGSVSNLHTHTHTLVLYTYIWGSPWFFTHSRQIFQ